MGPGVETDQEVFESSAVSRFGKPGTRVAIEAHPDSLSEQ